MADSSTSNLDLTLPEVGGSGGSWAGKLNDNFSVIDAFAGKALNTPEDISVLPSATNRAGRVLAFDADGNPTALVVSDTADSSLRTDLAATTGATLSGTIGVGAHATARTLRDKGRDFTNLFDWGATGTNDSGDQAKMQYATNEVSIGETLRVAPGFFKTTSYSLAQTREHDWILASEGVIRADNTVGQNFNGLRVNVLTNAVGASVLNSEVRNMRIKGGKILTHNTSSSDDYAAGGYAVSINDDAAGPLVTGNSGGQYYAQIGLVIRDMNLFGSLGGVYFGGDGTHDSMQYCGIQDSTVTNGVVMSKTSDGMFTKNCIFSGHNPGITVDSLAGAFNNTFEGGTATGRKGALDVTNGSFGKLLNVQIEYGSDNTGDCNQTYQSMIVLRGSSYPIVGWQIKGCHHGHGAHVKYNIAVDNAIGTIIDENYFNYNSTLSGADILFVSANAKHTIIGYRNQFRGTRSRAATGTPTDVTRLMKIDSAVAYSTLVGTKGLWLPLSTVATIPGGSLGNVEVMFHDNCEVVMQGSGTVNATTGTIATLPTWLRPNQNTPVLLYCNNAFVPGLITASTGVLSAVGTLANTTVDFGQCRFSAVGNTPYDANPL